MLDAALIDQVTTAFLAALQTGGQALGAYSLPLLGLCAAISFRKEYALTIMYGTGLGDALAGLLVTVMALMAYMWVMTNLVPMGNAALNTAFQWGLAGTGGTTLTVETINTPSWIMETGLKAAYPVGEEASWLGRVRKTVKQVVNPFEGITYLLVVLAFLAITAHHIFMLVEFHLSLMCAAVLLPFGLWSAMASLGEFVVGWLTGAVVRALVSTAMLGIALPLFALLQSSTDDFFDIYHQVILAAGAFIFMTLAWVVPARAAGLASRGMALGLHGGTIMSQAGSVARFGMMASGVGAAATRAHSRMMAARQMAATGP